MIRKIFNSSRTLVAVAGLITLALTAPLMPPGAAGVLEAQTNGGLTLVESGTRTATFNGNTFTNTKAQGAVFLLNVTAASGTTPTLDVKLQWMDPVTSTWMDLSGAAFQQITATGQRTLRVQAGAEPRGKLRIVLGTDQAAGTEVTETVPANTRWRLVSLAATIATSGVAGSRQPAIAIDDGTTANTALQVGNATSTAASGGALSVWSSIGTAGGLGNGNAGPLPVDLVLLGGWRIRTSTAAFDVGDNWNAPKMLVEEWVGNYAGVALPRFIRAVSTIGGTTPSFTYSVTGALAQ